MAGTRPTLGFGASASASGPAVVGLNASWTDGGWDVQAQANTSSGPAVLRYRLAIAGQHNVRNSWAAAACALAAGVPAAAVERGLQSFEPVRGRSRAFAVAMGGRSVTVVDDTYNANPDSVRAACDVLRDLPGPRLLVLGDMGEVGTQGPQFHAEIGAYAMSVGIEHLLAVGELSQSAVRAFGGSQHAAQHFDSMDALNAALELVLHKTSSVLVKGSRFMKMERAVAAIQEIASQQGESACC
jgi:UDP-N-acetylmuramyl pentapeptide synthase